MANSPGARRAYRLNTALGHSYRQAALVGVCVAAFAVSIAWAQEATVEVKTAAPATVQAVGPDGKPMAVKAGPQAAKTPAGQPAEQKTPEQKAAEQKAGEQKAGEQKAAEPTVTQRPMKPDSPVNPEELKVRPDAEGKIRFSFNGQPWPAVLDWLATISGMSLDWQELPGDYLNLTTRQSYTVEEARDLINRHLFARGFTMLHNGEVLSVVNIKKLDAGMVPRVSPDELAKRSPYDFVKVSFPLEWMMAETAAEELKPMISPNGKLNALKGMNRLEVIDAVINLRDIQKVLKEEQSGHSEERLVREFPLQYARATDVIEMLNDLLGLENKKAPKGPMTPEQMQQQQQQAMMRAQQQQQQGGQPQPGGPKEKPQINLVVNMRKNSVLASAPPDKMKMIEQAVKALDVSAQGAENLMANVNRMQVYRLGAMDPEPLVKTLNELGLLDPTTRLEVDKRNRSIVAYASLADHLTIRALVNKLDGSGRSFEVVQLQRLEADYVAGTIDFMMSGAEKNDSQQRRPYYYGFGYNFGGQEEQKSNDKFRVDADVENNKLLLWANQIELDEVYKLLAKLGEVPSRGSNTNTVRILNLEPGEDTFDALERLRRAWPSLSPNPLVMPNKESMNGAEERPGRVKPERSSTRGTKNEEARSDKEKPDTQEKNGRRSGPVVVPIDRRHKPADEKSEPVNLVAFAAVPAVLHKTTPKSANAEQPELSEPSAATSTAHSDSQKSSEEGKADDASASRPDAKDGANAQQGKASANSADGAESSDTQAPAPPGNQSAEKAGPRSKGAQDDVNRLLQQLTPSDRRGQAASRATPPINVSVGPNGELIITSPDTEALDLFEEMVHQIAPQRREYKVFHLKHASAFSVALNLEDYFEVNKKKDNNRRSPYYFFYDDFGSQSSKNEPRRLSKRRELKFIYDTDTNTILVQGADPSQLRIIGELVEIYDRPEPVDSRAARMTTVFTLKFSKAKIVGESVKDVYRDLLSSNDKALQQGDQQQKNSKKAENVYITNFGGDEGGDPRGTQVKFKGKLSIGIDEFSNTLIVSTEGENLMNNVSRMIEALDQAAKPAMSHVQVLKLGGSMDSKDVRKALSRAFLEQQPRGQPPQQGQPQPGQNGQPQQNQPGQQAEQNGQNVRNE